MRIANFEFGRVGSRALDCGGLVFAGYLPSLRAEAQRLAGEMKAAQVAPVAVPGE